MPLKIIFSKPMFSTLSAILTLILLILICFLPSFAHDESQDDTDSEVASKGKFNVRAAKTSTVKVLVKYPTTLANKKLVMEIYLNEIATNQPIIGTNITAIFNYFSDQETNNLTLQKPIFATALPTQEKGNYLAEVIFPQTGKYKLTLIMSKPNLDAQVIIPNIIIPDKIPILVENKPLVQSNNNNYFTIGIILFISSLLIIIVVKKYVKK
ncbi:MAG: hypothetical protein HY819_13840 [Acidobacteria bacterium]|nr:hypothetical protein [Acidobacteriota bacterium]